MNTQAIDAHGHDHEHEIHSKVTFGFWTFLLSDCILFSALFATYAVLYKNTYGGIGITQVATLGYIVAQTLVLLTSRFTFGLAAIAFDRRKRGQVLFWSLVTILLGLAFLGFDYREFANLLQNGFSWKSSAFLSSFFTLVGMHGAHLLAGLLWLFILMIQLLAQNFSPSMKTRFVCFGLFWDFLNIIWIFIFTIVYLMGAI